MSESSVQIQEVNFYLILKRRFGIGSISKIIEWGKENFKWIRIILILLMIFGFFFLSKEGEDVEIGYSIGNILRVSCNSDGEITFSGTAPVPLLIGTFELTWNKTISTIMEEIDRRILIIVKDDIANTYELLENFEYEIQAGEGIAIFKNLYEENGDIVLTLDTIDPKSISPNEKMTFLQSSISLSKPSENEIEFYPSIWNVNDIPPLNMYEPDRKTYNVSVKSSDILTWPYYWCALGHDLLSDNLENMTIRFYVNDELVPDILIYRYSKIIDNWVCRYWSTKVFDWKSGEVVNLEIYYTLLNNLFDGKDTYPIGEYIYELIVSVD